jgi:hypothetical protein
VPQLLLAERRQDRSCPVAVFLAQLQTGRPSWLSEAFSLLHPISTVQDTHSGPVRPQSAPLRPSRSTSKSAWGDRFHLPDPLCSNVYSEFGQRTRRNRAQNSASKPARQELDTHRRPAGDRHLAACIAIPSLATATTQSVATAPTNWIPNGRQTRPRCPDRGPYRAASMG